MPSQLGQGPTLFPTIVMFLALLRSGHSSPEPSPSNGTVGGRSDCRPEKRIGQLIVLFGPPSDRLAGRHRTIPPATTKHATFLGEGGETKAEREGSASDWRIDRRTNDDPPGIARPWKRKTPDLRGLSDAAEWSRTITGVSTHKALNLARLPVPPQPLEGRRF
jgi:hypothetical protein